MLHRFLHLSLIFIQEKRAIFQFYFKNTKYIQDFNLCLFHSIYQQGPTQDFTKGEAGT